MPNLLSLPLFLLKSVITHAKESDWGFTELQDYLLNDACLVEAMFPLIRLKLLFRHQRNVVGRVEEAWGYTYGVWFSNNTIPSDTRFLSGYIVSLSTRPDYLVMEVNSKSGSNLTKVMWKVEILKAVYGSKSHSTGGNGKISKVTWRIENFSGFKKDQRLCSEKFSVDGNKWRLTIYPKGDNKNVDHLSIYLAVADSATLPSGWSRFVQCGFAVISQIDRKKSIARVAKKEFKAKESGWGMPLVALSELQNPKRGHLLNDACIVEAYISTDRTDCLISRELILETDLDKHKTKEKK
ncbi:hypothetical protein V6N12_042669 [Hibiscus sabdariffa]|uniref:MATH domain-containing protein n=1 Tax=Hibiscus sabdariffa TaxID=183260 RepID=A0ABR2AM07_9ROSI